MLQEAHIVDNPGAFKALLKAGATLDVETMRAIISDRGARKEGAMVVNPEACNKALTNGDVVQEIASFLPDNELELTCPL